MHFCDFQCGRLRYGWMVLIGVLIQSASQRQVRTTQHRPRLDHHNDPRKRSEERSNRTISH
jgi:hypothetical protein